MPLDPPDVKDIHDIPALHAALDALDDNTPFAPRASASTPRLGWWARLLDRWGFIRADRYDALGAAAGAHVRELRILLHRAIWLLRDRDVRLDSLSNQLALFAGDSGPDARARMLRRNPEALAWSTVYGLQPDGAATFFCATVGSSTLGRSMLTYSDTSLSALDAHPLGDDAPGFSGIGIEVFTADARTVAAGLSSCVLIMATKGRTRPLVHFGAIRWVEEPRNRHVGYADVTWRPEPSPPDEIDLYTGGLPMISLIYTGTMQPSDSIRIRLTLYKAPVADAQDEPSASGASGAQGAPDENLSAAP